MEQRPSESLVFESVQAYVQRVYGQGRRATKIRIQLDDGQWLSLPCPHALCDPDATPPPMKRPPARHSSDYRSVVWFGSAYAFTEPQAAVVAQLWEAWENGCGDVGDRTLLRASGSDATRLADVFRDSPAWGVLIVEGETRGTHRLKQPAAPS